MTYGRTVNEERELGRCKGEIARAINKLRPDLMPAFHALPVDNWVNRIGLFLDQHFPIAEFGVAGGSFGWEAVGIRSMAQRLLLGRRDA